MGFWFIDMKARCPVCGASVSNEHPPGQPRVCPRCGTKLQISRARLKRDGWIAILLAFIAAAIIERTWWRRLVCFAITILPAEVVVAQVTARISRPKLEPWDGHKLIG